MVEKDQPAQVLSEQHSADPLAWVWVNRHARGRFKGLTCHEIARLAYRGGWDMAHKALETALTTDGPDRDVAARAVWDWALPCLSSKGFTDPSAKRRRPVRKRRGVPKS